MKRCPRCKLEKLEDEYYTNSSTGKPTGYCKDCTREYYKKRHIIDKPHRKTTKTVYEIERRTIAQQAIARRKLHRWLWKD